MGVLPELACALAAAGGLASLVGRPGGRDSRVSTLLMAGTALALWVAVAAVAVALLTEDTSMLVVVEQTRPNTSWMRRLTGLWSGAEGSLLLFVAIVVSAMVCGFASATRWQQVGIAAIAAGLAGAVAWGADPFQRVDLPPVGGVGMAPILEHGAMFVHPPLLYAATALALVPAIASTRARARRTGMVAFGGLTVALGLGASWAYVELGWGGWWAWDPIENVGLVLWLLLAGGLHAELVDTGSGIGRPSVWYGACWPTVFAGAALTRTSLRTSVHAFADATELAVWLWPLAVLAALGAVAQVGTGVRDRNAVDEPSVSIARWSPLVALAIVTVVVALGTWRPFVGGDGTEGWFYSRSLYPVAVVGAVAMGSAPFAVSRFGTVAGGVARAPALRLVSGALIGVGIAVGLGSDRVHQFILGAALGAGLGLTVGDLRRSPVRGAAHLGVLLVLCGALGSSAGVDADVDLAIGESTVIDGLHVELAGINAVETVDGRSTSTEVQASLRVDTTRLEPSVTYYPDRSLRLPEIATHSRPWRDVQAILRSVDAADVATITVRVRPLTQLVWWGVGLIAVAALIGAARRPRR